MESRCDRVTMLFSIACRNIYAHISNMNLSDRRFLALYILCLGDLMIVLDTTIVNVALPSIKSSLVFSDTSLVWVINAYILTFAGFMLLGGRLGDIYGTRP